MLTAMDGRTADLNHLTSQVIKAAINVHSTLGPGLLESVYQQCMEIELQELGLKTESQVPVAVVYRGRNVAEEGFRMDLLVEGILVIELKSVEEIKPVHQKQLLTYLRLAQKPLGLLINFNVPMLKEGIHRIINSSKATPSA